MLLLKKQILTMILIKSILLCCLLILKYLEGGFSKVLYLLSIQVKIIADFKGAAPRFPSENKEILLSEILRS
jgi:hypothetical protein